MLSLVFFSTTSGVYVLDIVDHFINQFGILLVAVVSMLVVAWGVRALPTLAGHLNAGGSVPIGDLVDGPGRRASRRSRWRYVLVDALPRPTSRRRTRATRSGCCSPSGGAPPPP